MVDETDQSLLRRVKDPADAVSWREFFGLYHPLLVRFGRKHGLSRADAEDVAQDCMRVLSEHMRSFDYSRGKGSFKGYLRTLANNTISNMFRRQRPRVARSGELSNVECATEPSLDAWDETWMREHLRHCLKLMETRFAAHTIAAFKMYAIDEQPIDDVCRALNLSQDQVYQAKSRVTQRLREEMRRLIGDVA